MYETLRIVEKLKPKYVIWENVKNLLSKKHRHNFDAYLDAMDKLDYKSKYKVLNAKDFGVPQNRERVFTVSIRKDIDKEFEFPEPMPLTIRLKDILEPEVDEKYYLSDEQTERLMTTTYNSGKEENRVQNTDGESRTLRARDWKDPKCVRVGGLYDKPGEKHQAGSVYDPNGISGTLSTMQGGNQEPIVAASRGKTIATGDTMGTMQDLRIRKLTPKECWRLMGFDDSDFEKAEKVNSNSQLYKQAGNSIVVNVLMSILNNLLGGKHDSTL
jgi:DNA (cytosine-5)-methyltransferase 1